MLIIYRVQMLDVHSNMWHNDRMFTSRKAMEIYLSKYKSNNSMRLAIHYFNPDGVNDYTCYKYYIQKDEE